MDLSELLLRFGTAIAIGFMIGLQREYALGGAEREIVAGERTFALMGLSGCLTAMVVDILASPLILLGVIFFFGALITLGYFNESRVRGEVGITTEVAGLVVVLVGALCYWDHLALAVAIGIGTTVLLSLKLETDRLVRALTRADIFAALQFAVVSAIVLPVLPNKSFLPPPFDVLNPFNIWLMVVFISGIGFLGYVLIKILGPAQGIGLTGLLGGLVSSTAVTLSFSERSRREIGLAKPFALAITIAWTMMFPRVLVEIGVLNPALLQVSWLPIAAAGLVGVLFCFYLWISQRASEKGEVEFSNPFDLVSAIKFGLLYGLVLLVSRTAQLYFGDTGIYISSIVSGMADVDAITLSMAELSSTGGLELEIASRAIVMAVMSNTVVKGGIVMMSGSVRLRRTLLPVLLLIVVTGIGLAFIA